jgi:hypothetical protein
MRLDGNVARMGENCVQRSEWKPEEKGKQIGPIQGRKQNIRMDLSENGWDGLEWIRLAHGSEHWRAVVTR